MSFAIIEALKKGIEEGKQYVPESKDESNDGLENT